MTMGSLRATNWLLLGIFAVLLAHLFGLSDALPTVVAETLRLDQCITTKPNDKPLSYVHVVTHAFSGD